VNNITKDRLLRELDKLSLNEAQPRVFVFDELGSTNQWLLDHLNDKELKVCVANSQIAGRGREGRSWVSPDGNIYMSFNYCIGSEISDFSAISLVMGVVLIRVLRSVGVNDVNVKWPNDILLDDSKLAGILIETKKANKNTHLVIGIGLNVQMIDECRELRDSKWSDLSAHGLGLKDRERVIALILVESKKTLQQFFNEGFGVFREEWMKSDVYAGMDVNILDRGKVILSGVESGVDRNGMLQVLSGSKLIKVHSGDVSLRIKS